MKTDDWEGKWQQDPFQHFQGFQLYTSIYLAAQASLRGHLAQEASRRKKNKNSPESIYHVFIPRHCTQVAIPAWDCQPSACFACAFFSGAACALCTERTDKKKKNVSPSPTTPTSERAALPSPAFRSSPSSWSPAIRRQHILTHQQ